MRRHTRRKACKSTGTAQAKRQGAATTTLTLRAPAAAPLALQAAPLGDLLVAAEQLLQVRVRQRMARPRAAEPSSWTSRSSKLILMVYSGLVLPSAIQGTSSAVAAEAVAVAAGAAVVLVVARLEHQRQALLVPTPTGRERGLRLHPAVDLAVPHLTAAQRWWKQAAASPATAMMTTIVPSWVGLPACGLCRWKLACRAFRLHRRARGLEPAAGHCEFPTAFALAHARACRRGRWLIRLRAQKAPVQDFWCLRLRLRLHEIWAQDRR